MREVLVEIKELNKLDVETKDNLLIYWLASPLHCQFVNEDIEYFWFKILPERSKIDLEFYAYKIYSKQHMKNGNGWLVDVVFVEKVFDVEEEKPEPPMIEHKKRSWFSRIFG